MVSDLIPQGTHRLCVIGGGGGGGGKEALWVLGALEVDGEKRPPFPPAWRLRAGAAVPPSWALTWPCPLAADRALSSCLT